MSKMPIGSNLIYNPSSAAPGFIIKKYCLSTGSSFNIKVNA